MKTSVETAAFGPLGPKRAASTVPTNRNVERLLTGPIGATLWRLAVPNTIGFLVGSGVTVAEMWFVGQLGLHTLAGLALGFPMFMLMQMLGAGAFTSPAPRNRLANVLNIQTIRQPAKTISE